MFFWFIFLSLSSACQSWRQSLLICSLVKGFRVWSWFAILPFFCSFLTVSQIGCLEVWRVGYMCRATAGDSSVHVCTLWYSISTRYSSTSSGYNMHTCTVHSIILYNSYAYINTLYTLYSSPLKYLKYVHVTPGSNQFFSAQKTQNTRIFIIILYSVILYIVPIHLNA